MKQALCGALAALVLLTGCLGLDGAKDALPLSSSAGGAASSTPQITGTTGPADAQQSSTAPAATFKLVVPEGYTLARIGMTLDEAGICTTQQFIDAAQTGDFSDFSLVAQQPYNENRCYTLEGYLFPATYEFRQDATPEEIIRAMLTALEQRIDDALREEIAAAGWTVDAILTLASVIEKEAHGEESMSMISSIFHNRLNQGMQLQSDVTINYVNGAIEPFVDGDIEHFKESYNTYKCAALPAGPICNPGKAAILAALRPASTDYLFFVTDKNNQFYYAVTYDEHLATIQRLKDEGLWE